MPNLRQLLDTVHPGPALDWQNVTVVPLTFRDGPRPPLDYVLASDAIEHGLVDITEVDEAGVVGNLLATSEAEIPVLLVDGEELVGAKQNRILNTDVLLRPHGKRKIPVSCVEQGRWHRRKAACSPGGYAPSSLRTKKSESVSQSLRESLGWIADQTVVWEEVGTVAYCLDSVSATDAMSDVFHDYRRDIERFVQELPCPQTATGVVVMIGGRFTALDLFDQPATLQKLWSRLLTGYAVDSLLHRAEGKPGRKPDALDALLDMIGEIECAVHPGVDLGEEWRFDSSHLAGSALVVDDTALHLGVCARSR